MTDDEILELANNYMDGGLNIRSVFSEDLIAFARAVAVKERERCAKICEDHFMSDGDWCAKQIRGEG